MSFTDLFTAPFSGGSVVSSDAESPPLLSTNYGQIGGDTSFSTPVQSPTPNTGGGNPFSDIVSGVGKTLSSAIPQFTTALLQAGGQNLINDTFKGGVKTPTTAQPQSNASIFSSPSTWLIVGGLVVGVVGVYFLLKD